MPRSCKFRGVFCKILLKKNFVLKKVRTFAVEITVKNARDLNTACERFFEFFNLQNNNINIIILT